MWEDTVFCFCVYDEVSIFISLKNTTYVTKSAAHPRPFFLDSLHECLREDIIEGATLITVTRVGDLSIQCLILIPSDDEDPIQVTQPICLCLSFPDLLPEYSGLVNAATQNSIGITILALKTCSTLLCAADIEGKMNRMSLPLSSGIEHIQTKRLRSVQQGPNRLLEA